MLLFYDIRTCMSALPNSVVGETRTRDLMITIPTPTNSDGQGRGDDFLLVG